MAEYKLLRLQIVVEHNGNQRVIDQDDFNDIESFDVHKNFEKGVYEVKICGRLK